MPFTGSFNIQGSFGEISAANFDSGTATDGQVLTADGAGGAAWENAAGGSAAYLVYVALLTQTDENAPVATVLENTLGGAIVWTRSNAGLYTGALVGGFDPLKTLICVNNFTSNYKFISASVDGGGNIIVNTAVASDGDLGQYINVDSSLVNTPIEIRVYP